ncbi:MAG TPA: restriction endonuclease, partial [Anaerolineae bacterium]|nr:restriction endonuclease [Anaerolineae bacterium]
TGYYLGNTSYLISMERNRRYALGVLNSKVFHYYATAVFVGKQSGWYEVQPLALEAFPIPISHSTQPIETIVDSILAAKAQNPAADVGALEAEIDQQVYALYGLTAEEIRIMEGEGR